MALGHRRRPIRADARRALPVVRLPVLLRAGEGVRWPDPGLQARLARQPLHLFLEAPVLRRGIESANHGIRDEAHAQPELQSPREERGPEPLEVTGLEDDGPRGAGMSELRIVDRD